MKKYPKCEKCGKPSAALTNGWCDACACLVISSELRLPPSSTCVAFGCNTPSQDDSNYCAFHFREIGETWRKRYQAPDSSWTNADSTNLMLFALVVFVGFILAVLVIEATV